MKMGIGTRIVFTIFLLIIIGLSVLVILGALGAIPAADLQQLWNGYTQTGYKYIYVAVSLVIILIAIALMFFGAKKAEPTSVVLQTTADGSVSVLIAAIDELAQRYLNEVYGILVQSVHARSLGDRNVRLSIRLSVKPEVVIPEVTGAINKEIKEYIQKYSGIIVSDVSIRVLPLKQSAK